MLLSPFPFYARRLHRIEDRKTSNLNANLNDQLIQSHVLTILHLKTLRITTPQKAWVWIQSVSVFVFKWGKARDERSGGCDFLPSLPFLCLEPDSG